jgi:flavoprotein
MMAEMSLQAACAIDDYYNLRDSIRKEIEGKFIDGAIKSAELAGGNKPFEVGRCKRRGKEYRVSIIVTPVDKNEMPKIACPKCGAQYDDYDGLSFSYCPACGYCSHPNSTVENGKEICGICGREIKKEV